MLEISSPDIEPDACVRAVKLRIIFKNSELLFHISSNDYELPRYIRLTCSDLVLAVYKVEVDPGSVFCRNDSL